MKRPFRVTWEKPTGETGIVDIEAESRGQAKRIFIQRGGELKHIMTIEESEEAHANDRAGFYQCALSVEKDQALSKEMKDWDVTAGDGIGDET